MSKLTWSSGNYESGLDRGVFYPKNAPGESWSGLVSVQASYSYSDKEPRYIDGKKSYVNGKRGQFSGTIEAFTYPNSFYEDVLMQHRQNGFGLSYRVDSKIHIVYNVLIQPGSNTTQQLVADTFRWNFTTTAVEVPGKRMSAHLIVDTDNAYESTTAELEDLLYGSESGSARLPLPEEILAIFDDNSILRVTDNGDGSFTVEGPDAAIQMLDATTFQISWPSAIYIDLVSYTLSSL